MFPCSWEPGGGSANPGHWAVSLASGGGQTRGSIELHSGRGAQSPCLGRGPAEPRNSRARTPLSLSEPKRGVHKGGTSGQRCQTMPQAITLNHHGPWDTSSSPAFADPPAEREHPLCSPSPGLVGELEVMNAEKAEIQGRTNSYRGQGKSQLWSTLSTTTFDKWGH